MVTFFRFGNSPHSLLAKVSGTFFILFLRPLYAPTESYYEKIWPMHSMVSFREESEGFNTSTYRVSLLKGFLPWNEYSQWSLTRLSKGLQSFQVLQLFAKLFPRVSEFQVLNIGGSTPRLPLSDLDLLSSSGWNCIVWIFIWIENLCLALSSLVSLHVLNISLHT